MSIQSSNKNLPIINYNELLNESIVAQGLIVPEHNEKSLTFCLAYSNRAFNQLAGINPSETNQTDQDIFSFIEGYNSQSLKKFFTAENLKESNFIYSSNLATYKLSFKKISEKNILFSLQDISDIQSSRSELNEKKRQLKESQEIAHLGYWVENYATKKHLWSDQIFGILNETIGSIEPSFNNYLNFVHPDDRVKVEESFKSSKENKNGYENAHRLILNNNSIKHIYQRWYTNYDDQNMPIQSVGIVQDITASELVKEELKKSEAIFRSVFDFAPIAIVLVNEQHQPVFCNKQFSEIVGYSIDEIYKRGLKDFTYPDDYENNLNQYQRLFKGDITSFSLTKRYLRKDGTQLWAKVIVSAIKNVNGPTEMAIAMVQDISAEKSATEAMVKSEFKYRTLIENASDGIGLFDYNFKPIIYNTVLYEMLGYSLEEYLQFDHNKYELFHEDDIPNASKAIAQIKDNKPARIENRMRHKDGSYSYFSINYIPVSHDGKPSILIFRRDINKRKKAEQQNEEYRLFLETLMDNLPVSLFAKTTPDFRYLYWNRTMENMSGISADDAIGKTDFELMQFKSMADQYHDEDLKLLKFRKKLESEHEFSNSQGKVNQFRTIKTLHKSSIGNPLILGISMDITKLKEAEVQVEQSNQMLKEAQKIAKLGYWEYDVKKDLFFDNLENRQILGTDTLPYFINSKQFKELLHAEDQMLVEQKFLNCINNKIPGDGIIRIINHKGPKHISIKYRAVEDDLGNVQKLRGTCIDITRIRQSEMALRESETRLKQAEHIAKVGYYDYNYQTKETKFSDEIWKILEVNSPTTNISLGEFFNTVHDDDKMNVTAQFQKSKKTNQPFNIDFKIVTHNNNTKYIKAIGTFVKNQDGTIVRSIGTFQDVTDLKQNEKALQITTNQLLDIQQIAKIGFIDYNIHSKEVRFSDILKNVLELKKQDSAYTMHDFDKFIHVEDRETITKTIQKSIANRQSYNLQYRLKLNNGKIKFINEICCVNPSDSLNAVTRIIQDITHLKEQEIAFNKISNVHESNLLGSWEYNLNTKKYTISADLSSHINIHDYDNELNENQIFGLIHEDDRHSVDHAMKECIRAKQNFTLSFRMILDNEIQYVQAFSNFYSNSSSDDVLYVMIRNISEYRNILNVSQDRAELYSAITENSFLGIVMYHEGERIFSNKKWSELVGLDETSTLTIDEVYKPESTQLIREIFKTWKDFEMTEYSNKITLHPLHAKEFTAEVFVKEIQYKNKNVFLIILLPKV